jgi:hypothetical protein
VPTFILFGLVGFAVWKVSKAASDPWIFRFFLGSALLGIALAGGAAYYRYLSLVDGISTPPIFSWGSLVLRAVAAVLIYASFVRVAGKLGYGLFAWAARLVLVTTVLVLILDVAVSFENSIGTSSVVGIGIGSLFVGIIGLATFVVEVAAFNSLGGRAIPNSGASTT